MLFHSFFLIIKEKLKFPKIYKFEDRPIGRSRFVHCLNLLFFSFVPSVLLPSTRPSLINLPPLLRRSQSVGSERSSKSEANRCCSGGGSPCDGQPAWPSSPSTSLSPTPRSHRRIPSRIISQDSATASSPYRLDPPEPRIGWRRATREAVPGVQQTSPWWKSRAFSLNAASATAALAPTGISSCTGTSASSSCRFMNFGLQNPFSLYCCFSWPLSLADWYFLFFLFVKFSIFFCGFEFFKWSGWCFFGENSRALLMLTRWIISRACTCFLIPD